MRVRPLAAMALGVGLLLAGLPARAQAQAQACPTVTSATKPFYPGPSASGQYDSAFRVAFHVPYLTTYTPQGMAVWNNWNGHDDLVLMGMYRKGSRSYLVAFDPKTGKRYATVEVAEGHLGGMAVAGKFLFAQDAASMGAEPVRRYKLSTLAAALKKAHKKDSKPYVKRSGSTQTVHGASFMTSYAGHVWAGHINSTQPDAMYEYKVAKSGKLTKVGSGWQVPALTQGVVVTSDLFLFSISNGFGPGSLVVAGRQHSLDPAAGCMRIPSMGESMVRLGDEVLIDFEGGSYQYPSAANRVGDVHEAALQTVRAILAQRS